jgi:hypothetical protein
MLKHRDIRPIVAKPIFHEPLPSLPRGNVRFVLIGGIMEYVDRRGCSVASLLRAVPGPIVPRASRG